MKRRHETRRERERRVEPPNLVPGIYLESICYVSIRVTSKRLISEQFFCRKERKQHALPGDDASTAEVAPSGIGRGEQGDARRANSAPRSRPYREQIRFRPKTWS